MGLDVYVGSLTRYYAEGPQAVVDRIARQQGVELPVGSTAEEILRAAVVAWRDGLGRWLGDRLPVPLDWDESGQAPCFTEKPGWDGYGGALLLAAHDEHPDLPVPAAVSADWPDDLAYQAATAAGAESRYEQLLAPELWLPCWFPFTVRTHDVAGEEVVMGSSVSLLTQVRALGDRAAQATAFALAAAATVGLDVLARLAERSVEHRLPMKLDF